MRKKLEKFLAAIVTLCMIATLCAVPMTASAASADETYDTFDEITLSDLGLTPGNFENEINKGPREYMATSASYSVAVKFQWQAGDFTPDNGWFVSFDSDYNFGAAAWFRSDHIYFGFTSDLSQILSPITEGTHDVEFGRKLVISGQNEGKYYVYLIVDNETIASGYATFSNTTNVISFNGGDCSEQRFADCGVEPETYDTFDKITLSDLGLTPGNFENEINKGPREYTATSTSYSVAVKFQWQAGDFTPDNGWFVSFDADYNFGAAAWFRSDQIIFCYGNDELQRMNLSPITEGTHDVEFGRKLVTSGQNEGKYYVYLIVDNETIASGYTTFSNTTNVISFNGGDCSEQRFADCGVEPETYDTFDVITLSDLGLTPGNFENEINKGPREYTATSASYSVAVKFQWQAGDFTPDNGWFVSFDADYNFGAAAWFRSDHIYFGFTSDLSQILSPITEGTHNVEFGRKLVTSGQNEGKYYVYLIVDNETIASGYTTFSNTTNVISFNGGDCSEQRFADAVQEEEYEDYVEIGYGDLTAVDGEESAYTYDDPTATYSVKFKFLWIAGEDPQFTVFFDAFSFPFAFAAKYPNQSDFGETAGPNGAWHLVPSDSSLMVNMDEPIVAGRSYGIEVGRLKVKGGRNAGKYYVYFMVNGELIQSYYYDGVNEAGRYGDGDGTALSNKIYLCSTEGNRFANYRESGNDEHDGMRGDLNDDGVITAEDTVILKKIILGIEPAEMNEKPREIADYNNDDEVDVVDLVAMKKYLAPVNEYAKTGDLTLGTQEHLLEYTNTFVDNTKTASYIADASAALGADAYRLSFSLNRLFEVSSADTLAFNAAQKALLREMVDALKNSGINNILYVNDTFLEPHIYYGDVNAHGNTVPNPKTDAAHYALWLELNAEAFRMIAEEFPEIKYYEPFNEPNLISTRLEKYGIGWVDDDDLRAAYKYTVSEKAGIMADICWYVSKAVKSVDSANQVTTPSVATSIANSNVENEFIEELYKCIVSGNYPTAQVVSDIRIENYFTIVNIHGYPDFQNTVSPDLTNFENTFIAVYNIMKAYNDGGSRVWLTEMGVTDKGSRNRTTVARNMQAALNVINRLTFIDTVFVYKLADSSTDMGFGSSETYYGLFYAGDDFDYAYEAKPVAKTVYSFFNNGSTDYSALDNLVASYK